MTTLLFSLISAGLFGLSYILIFKRRWKAKDRNDLFIKRRKKRSIGLMLLFPATLTLIVAIVNYCFSDFFSANPLNKAALTEIQPAENSTTSSAPVAPKPPPAPSTTNAPPTSPAPTSSNTVASATPPAPVAPAAPPKAPATKTPDGEWILPPEGANPTPPAQADNSPSGAQAQSSSQKEIDAALGKLDADIKANPNDPVAYLNRGNIHASMSAWELAEYDYRSALKINTTFVEATFNLAEMDFHLKKYESARAEFATLESNVRLGDLASYKVFLCDLFGGNESTAQKELDAFNQTGTGAPYYFANLAWCLFHKKTTDAHDWLTSAVNIYPSDKIDLYTANLKDLGYLSFAPNQ